MKTLIAYATKYGATEKAARKLAEQLSGEVELINLVQKRTPDISGCDRVIIGGSIYCGNIQEEVKQFSSENQQQLLQQPLGLFICCKDEENADEQLQNAFDPQLVQHAAHTGYFGYEYNFRKMNFFLRMLIRKFARIKESQFKLREENISDFARKMDSE
ncbi:MAG: flavodoxin domain-containing protein [Spirochaeta sp.]